MSIFLSLFLFVSNCLLVHYFSFHSSAFFLFGCYLACHLLSLISHLLHDLLSSYLFILPPLFISPFFTITSSHSQEIFSTFPFTPQDCQLSDRPRPLLLIFDRSADIFPPLMHTSTYQVSARIVCFVMTLLC